MSGSLHHQSAGCRDGCLWDHGVPKVLTSITFTPLPWGQPEKEGYLPTQSHLLASEILGALVALGSGSHTGLGLGF